MPDLVNVHSHSPQEMCLHQSTKLIHCKVCDTIDCGACKASWIRKDKDEEEAEWSERTTVSTHSSPEHLK